MTEPIIIGIHGLHNKPPKNLLEGWWADAIAEGLQRNHHLALRPSFALAYWADIRNPQPLTPEESGDRYEQAAGQGALPRYDLAVMDALRAVSQEWVGALADKEKQLFGLGTNVERLIGVRFDDLAEYYAKPEMRRWMRARLAALLERHQDKRIMLIGHSMGSIISYDVLRTFDTSATLNIEHFITIGAPLGLPIVAHKVREEFGTVQTPQIVRRWTNLADPRDKVALDCNLADEYRSYNSVQVTDVLVHNGYVNHFGVADTHKSYGYLRAPELSDCIRDFLLAGE